MNEQQVWIIWRDFLHRTGLGDFTAWLLDAAIPVHLLGAQILYLGQPILNPLFPNQHIESLAELLETPEKSRAFIAYLREGSTS